MCILSPRYVSIYVTEISNDISNKIFIIEK